MIIVIALFHALHVVVNNHRAQGVYTGSTNR